MFLASTSDQPSSSNPSIIKSVRSAWKKAKFRHWRRTMDLENSKTECQETQEANFDKSKANGENDLIVFELYLYSYELLQYVHASSM